MPKETTTHDRGKETDRIPISWGRGNRTSAKGGGDASGSNPRTSVYYPNALNQYWSNTVPGAVDVRGVALATNSVTVNGQAPYRKGEYFRKELAVNNTAAPVWQQITVAAPNEATVTRHEFVAQTPQVFVHDDDGNLVSDGRWNYTWDGENRLVAMAARTGVGPQISLKFEYDAQGRRIRKQVWGNAAWSGSATNDLRFVYDGWNVIAVLSPQSAVLRSFTWGLDLSGTLQGAGGVGGLVAMNVHSGASAGTFFYCLDGNGNVAALINANDGTVAARYEYGPFGELLRASGSLAGVNPFRFSTKYQDEETGLLYYGYRYYNAITGRWLNPDPIGLNGGLNIYSFLDNFLAGDADRLGLTPIHLEFNAFIPGPPDWLPEPYQPGKQRLWFASDRRSFLRGPAQTARLRTEVAIDSQWLESYYPEVVPLSDTVSDLSYEKNSDTGVITSRRPEASGAAMILKTERCCQLKITMTGSGKHPFSPGWLAPSIDYHVTWTLRGVGLNRIKITIEGERDSFPAYEAVANWDTSVYSHRPTDPGPTWENLSTPVRFRAEEEIFADTDCGVFKWPF